jgi:hypothetical protein
MTVTSPASDPFATPDLDRAIAEAESTAVVGWRAERIPFREIPERIARIDPREDRDRLYGGPEPALRGAPRGMDRRG